MPPLLALASLVALPQGSADPFVPSAFRTLDGTHVELWATSPLLHNPTAIDVDEHGRVWVTEGVRYRRWGGRNPGLERAGDRVVIVEDTDGDGRADTSKVFVQDPELVSPLGILVLDDVVLVSASPNLYAYHDDDGDDVADRRTTLLTGFGGPDHDHGLHSAVLGPDGSLYLAAGNAGPHLVTDADGWTLRSGSVYVGGGRETADNAPGLVSDDGRAWTGGVMLRVEPDGIGLRVLAHNFRNQYEVAIDPFGRMWTADNDDDGNRGCRATWVQPGGDHGYFSADGTRYWQPDRRPGQSIQRAHWHADDPGVSPPGSLYGSGSPTGVAFVADGPFAEVFGDTLLTCDAGRGIVFAWKPVEDGAGWKLEERRLLEPTRETEDGGDWFRPSDVALAPDGSVFVADWWDPGVGGHHAGDRSSAGHLYRVTTGAERDLPSSTEDANAPFAALSHPAAAVRQRALQRLAGEVGHRVAMIQSVSPGAERAASRARAYWLVGRKEPTRLVQAVNGERDARAREAALNVLARFHRDALPALAREHGWASSPHAAVRRTVANALEGVPLDDALDLWLALAAAHAPGDRVGLEAFGAGARGVEEALWPELVLAEGTTPTAWSPRFEDIAWRLHPAAATDAWTARALEPRLDVEARRRALDALAFSPGRTAAEAMVAAHLTGPEDLREYALWWLEHRDTNDWRAYRLLEELPGGRADVADAEELWRSAPVEAGTVAVDVALDGVETLWLVVDPEGSNGHDWTDWLDPVVEVDGEPVSLAALPWRTAHAGWGEVRVDRNAGDTGPLRVDGREARGIGTHAPSTIGWTLPEGATRLRATAAIDDGGSTQPGARPRVHFEVRGTRRDAAPHHELVEAAFGPEASTEALAALARDPAGGVLLVRRAAEGLLDDAQRALVAEHVFANPDPAVRALASAHFTRPGERPLPSVAELLALDGDPDRGRETFLSGAAECSRCHAFDAGGFRVGGDLGPELTDVRRKFGREGLFDAILNPSAAIAHGYDTWLVEDADGRVFAGFLLADGELVVLKDTNGTRHAIPAEDVVWRQRQALSTMPQGIATELTPAELADLVAFLAHDPDEPPRFGAWRDLWNGRDLEGWTTFTAGGSPTPAETWTVQDGELVCAGTPIGYLRTEETFTNFQLELEWRFDPAAGPGNSGVLLRVHGEDVVWPDSIEAQLQHRNAGDVWNIGEFPMETVAARTSGRRTKRAGPSNEVPLGEWNRYRITLDHGHLTLEVNGVLQNEARWCREIPGHVALQAEGAVVRFRNVRLRPIE